MKRFLGILAICLLGLNTAWSQTQFLDQYSDLVVTSANTTGTNDMGWITVADVLIDSANQKLAVIKFDMCGEVEWSNLYGTADIDLHHAEIIELPSGNYAITTSDEDLSKGPTGIYLLELNNGGNVVNAINYSREGNLLSGFFNGTDLDILDTNKVVTEYETDNGSKALALFDQDWEVVWSKSYDGISNMTSPMAIETVNDSMVFITNSFQVAMLDTAGEVIWSMKNDSVVIWPEVAYLSDNTVGVLVSPLKVDSAERADNRRYVHLVTFPQGTPNPVMHEGDIKLLEFFPELHAVDNNFVMVSLDSIPDIDGYAQTFTVFDNMGAVLEQKYLPDFLSAGAQEVMPFMGFDFNSGFGYVTYSDRDSSVYFAKIGSSLEVEDPMSCMTSTRDSLRNELLNYWEDNPVMVDSIETTVDSVEIMILMDTLDLTNVMRQCENEIPDNEIMQPICPGDSIFIAGQWVKEEGTYMDTMVICEEEIITTYEISFFELVDELVNLSICPGDTIIISGVEVSSDTNFIVPFTVCDSLLDSVINVRVLQQLPPTTVTDVSCPGDTIQHMDVINGTLFIDNDTSFTVSVPDPRCAGFFITTDYVYRFDQEAEEFEELIPNAFTPNGDGMNDEFIVKQDTMLDLVISSYEMRVYNRWGQQVFQTNAFTQGWDGRNDGNDPLSEVYIYVIELVGRFNNCEVNRIFTGDVTLLR